MNSSGAHETQLAVPNAGEVSALFVRPPAAHGLLVLAHGAGAGMMHPFLNTLAQELAAIGVATLRYQFPYRERRRKFPDPPAVLLATVRAAVDAAIETAPDLPVLAGGKSMGGRMTSLAAAEHPLNSVRGLVFVGFPLHPPQRPGTERSDHLRSVGIPMLFLQGTRDGFAPLATLGPVCAALGPRATLHTVEMADHSFHVLRSSGTSDANVLRELAHTIDTWAAPIWRG